MRHTGRFLRRIFYFEMAVQKVLRLYFQRCIFNRAVEAAVSYEWTGNGRVQQVTISFYFELLLWSIFELRRENIFALSNSFTDTFFAINFCSTLYEIATPWPTSRIEKKKKWPHLKIVYMKTSWKHVKNPSQFGEVALFGHDDISLYKWNGSLTFSSVAESAVRMDLNLYISLFPG